MSTGVPLEEIRSIFATLSGVPTSHIYWEGEPERSVGLWGNAGQAGKLTLDVVSRVLLGGWEVRLDDSDLEIVGGTRILTISCRADAFIGLGKAFDLLEQIRIGFYRRSTRKSLRDAGLVFSDAPSITKLDYSVDNRAISSASLDIQFSQVPTDAPPQVGIDQTIFIEKVSRKEPEDIPDASVEPVVYLPFKFPP